MNLHFKHKIIEDIWLTVAPVIYPENKIIEEELAIWSNADENEFSSYEEAISFLANKIENFPEIDIEKESEEVKEFEKSLSHTNEEDYKVAVFTDTEKYIANSDIIKTKNMYVRNATEQEILANSVIETDEDRKNLKNQFGEEKYITFTSENSYSFGNENSANTIKVWVKDNSIFYEGIKVGEVINSLPQLKITSMASKFFRMKTVSVQDAKVEGGDYRIISNKELEKLINDRNDFESKLIVVSSRLGISKIDQVSAMQMSQKIVELLDYNNNEANKAKEELRISQEKLVGAEREISNLRKELESRPAMKIESQPEKEIIDVNKTNPLYVAYFKGKDNQRRYLIVNGKKLQHTAFFEKASKLSKTDLLPSVIKLATEKRIQFVIAKIKFEIQ